MMFFDGESVVVFPCDIDLLMLCTYIGRVEELLEQRDSFPFPEPSTFSVVLKGKVATLRGPGVVMRTLGETSRVLVGLGHTSKDKGFAQLHPLTFAEMMSAFGDASETAVMRHKFSGVEGGPRSERTEEAKDPAQCSHPHPLVWDGIEWCPRCGAIRPQEAFDIPSGEWSRPKRLW